MAVHFGPLTVNARADPSTNVLSQSLPHKPLGNQFHRRLPAGVGKAMQRLKNGPAPGHRDQRSRLACGDVAP